MTATNTTTLITNQIAGGAEGVLRVLLSVGASGKNKRQTFVVARASRDGALQQATVSVKRWEKGGKLRFYVNAALAEDDEGYKLTLGNFDVREADGSVSVRYFADRGAEARGHHAYGLVTNVFLALGEGNLKPWMAVGHTGTCSACGRKLTREDSKQAGMGPDCLAKALGV